MPTPTQFVTKAEVLLGALPASAIVGLSDAQIDFVLQAVSAELEDDLSPHGVLPITPPYPVGLKQLALDMAAPRLLTLRGVDPSNKAVADFFARGKLADEKRARIRAGTGLAGLIDATPNEAEGAPEVVSDTDRGWPRTGTL